MDADELEDREKVKEDFLPELGTDSFDGNGFDSDEFENEGFDRDGL